MIDFIGSTFTAATLAWAVAFAFQAIGFNFGWEAIGVTAMLLSAFAFTSLIIGCLVWAACHIRIQIQIV